MEVKMNKILVIGLIICNCQFANSSNINKNESDINIGNHNNYNVNTMMNIKNNINNVLTFANSNSKCWFVSTFQLFITALNQSEPNSGIRKTNFAKFVNHLKALNNTPRRIYERGELNKLRPSEWHFSTTGMWETHNLTKDRTGKSNVIGERIDLISELIKCGAKHDWIYKEGNNSTNVEENNIKNILKNNKTNTSKYGNNINIIKNNNKTDILLYNSNNINTIDKSNEINLINMDKYTKSEKDRRNEALLLLAQIQDMNSGAHEELALSIILNIFPELKQYFGSYLNETTQKDTMIDNAEKIMLNDKERTNYFIDILQNKRIPSSIDICRKQTHKFIIYIRKILHEVYLQSKNLSKRNNNRNKNINNINEIRILLTKMKENNKQIDNQSELHMKRDLIKMNRSLCHVIRKELAKITSLETEDKNGDSIQDYIDSLLLAHTNVLSFFKELNDIRNISRLKSLTFDTYKPLIKRLYLPRDNIHNIDKLDKNNTEYLIIPICGANIHDIVNYKYINSKQEIYELVGLYLANCEHAVSFVKTGKSDSSWSGIDSNRNANDDNYKLEDAVYYNTNESFRNKQTEKYIDYFNNNGIEDDNFIANIVQNLEFISDNSNNKYLAKVYKNYGYTPDFLLYKKISLNKLSVEKQQEITNYLDNNKT